MPEAKAANPVKEEEPKESYDEDDRLIALAKSKKRSTSNSSKPKTEELDGDDDEKPIKREKKGAGKSDAKICNVKKEEVDGEDDEKPLKRVKKGGKSSTSPSAVKKEEFDDLEPLVNTATNKTLKSNVKPSKLKKEEAEDSDKEEEKTKKRNKKVAGEVGKVGQVLGKEKRERKMYELPGQKHDPPEKRDPLRIFYETLYEQVPNSEMAAIWMMEWGLLPEDAAKKVYARKLKKLGSPIEAVSVKKTSTITVKKVTQTISRSKTVSEGKKRNTSAKSSDTKDDDDDFISSKKKKQKVSC